MTSELQLGARVRALRRREKLRQAKLAEMLGISPSYLNLIEHDKRPLSAPLLLKLVKLFDLDLASFGAEEDARLSADLMEVFGDPMFDDDELSAAEVRELIGSLPAVGKAVLRLYRRYREAADMARSMSDTLSGGAAYAGVDPSRVPTEGVGDFLQAQRNHFPALEAAAESFSRKIDLRPDDMYHAMAKYLREEHGIHIRYVRPEDDGGAVRRFDPERRDLVLSESLPRSSRKFQIAHQIALLTQSDVLDRIVEGAGLETEEAQRLCRVALANYYAGAVIMPYGRFIDSVRECRYDIELLGNRFGVSFEQVCHRLTTLQRPGNEGVPFHFVRADVAGNIYKRFSASGIQISRFGGACPRWGLHAAFLTPGIIVPQLSEMLDGRGFFCMSRTVKRGARGHHAPRAVHAVTLGCRVEHARELVYADGFELDTLSAAVPIGVTCRLCERMDCEQRAFPRLHQPLNIDENVRGISFFASVTDGGDDF